MTRRIIEGEKDINGAFLPRQKVDVDPSSLDIDAMLKDCLLVLRRMVDKLLAETSDGRITTRETTANLKDCQTMLLDLKKKEKDILEGLSDAELKKLLKAK